MKPSERIRYILRELCSKENIHPDSMAAIPFGPLAITLYLDEEWEKKQEAPDLDRDKW